MVLGGDLNGHVESARDGYSQCHGGNEFGSRNDAGIHIFGCAEAYELVVANIFFKKRPTGLITYNSGRCRTQLDYLIVRRCNLKLVTNVKVIPREAIVSHHHPLIMDLRLDILGQK